MAGKCIRRLMAPVTVKLLILSLVIVQANNHAPTSFNPSSIPIQLSHFSELDQVYGLLRICLKKKIGDCRQKIRLHGAGNFDYDDCIGQSFVNCLRYYEPFWGPIIARCVVGCLLERKAATATASKAILQHV
jgi:hypothetical protein